MKRRAGSAVIALALLVYTGALYLGLGVSANETHPALWEPTGFLRYTEFIGGLRDAPWTGVALLALPPLLSFGIAVTFVRRPGLVALAAVASVTCALFAYYGLSKALRVWEFFGWRGSAVLAVTGLGVGASLAAPWLAAAWMRAGATFGALWYAPAFVATVSLIRNATGTDESLFFIISPWPAIPVLGLEIGAYTLAGLWLGLGLGLGLVAHAEARGRARTLGFCLGATFPIVWFQYRFDFTNTRLLGIGLAFSAAALLIALAVRSDDAARAFRRRATACAVAGALIAMPLVAGRALSEGDYVVTRHVRAEALIEALRRHYADVGEYPETLDELVAHQYLEAVPAPRVGFDVYYALGWLDPIAFHYQNLGSSYVLEFVGTEWVMCSYNPPWPEDALAGEAPDGEDAYAEGASPAEIEACRADCERVCQEACDAVDAACASDCRGQCAELCAPPPGDDAADAGLGEAWSCPDARPELW